MTPALALALPYYRNPQMLAHQYGVWAAYPAEVRAQIEVVIVDDGSPAPEAAADVPRPAGLPALRIFRVLEDRPWHQHGARNLAMQQAQAPWVFLSDMDHVLPAHTAAALLPLVAIAPRDTVYTFARVDAPTLQPTRNARGELKPHVNTFALARAHYWAIGGYDEDLVGYGTDSYFRRRLKAASRCRHLDDLSIIRVPREVIPDASGWAPGVDPKAFRDAGRRGAHVRQVAARKAVTKAPPTVLAFPWEAVL